MTLSDHLHANGYALYLPHELVDMHALLAECIKPAAVLPKRRSFLTSLHVSPTLRAAVEHLDLAPLLTDYLPAAQLTSVDLYRSVPQSTPLKSGQLWHLDIDYAPQVKLFIMGQDTTAANGPFTFLSAPDSARIQRATSYIPGESLSDDRIDTTPLQLTGPAGSLVFVDTSRCLHFGSRVTTGSRLALVCQFA